MPTNKLALIRYKTIDECLQNRFRKWTLEDLIERVSQALYEYEGIDSGVSKRTIQADIQLMRSDKLGYNAPIVVKDRKFYTYEDPDFSISKAPLNPSDAEKLKQALNVLKQFIGFQHIGNIDEVITRLENNLYKSSQKSRNCIQFENNHLLKGIEHLQPLYQAVLHKKTLLISYKSFKARNISQNICYPYLLKEYRNRWFVIVKVKNKSELQTLALDRIESFQVLENEFFVDSPIDFDQYYNDLIGVTKTIKDKASKVILQVDVANAPYIQTKPLHHSQKVLKKDENGLIISIEVVLNFELEREILGLGEAVKVLAPKILVNKIKKRIENSLSHYQ
ncbi:MAG: WYL domain-containing protein [Flammeovirgaceae bacterium]